jgi:hypothetical protein
MARLDLRASLRFLIPRPLQLRNRRKLKHTKSSERTPILTSNSTPNFHATSSPIKPCMISSPTNIITIPDSVVAAPAIELKPASLTVGRDARMTRNYIVPPMPPMPVEDVETERLAIRREMSDDSAMKRARRRSTIALSTYSTHSQYYAPIHSN